jgi:hypothetical protein
LVVIGGGVSRAQERLLAPLRSAVAERIALPFDIPIVAARLGGEAAAHGALVFAFTRCATSMYGFELPAPPITPLGSGPSPVDVHPPGGTAAATAWAPMEPAS